MKKKLKLVMLSSSKASNFYLINSFNSNALENHFEFGFKTTLLKSNKIKDKKEYQHLYILSENEIKEGDYVLLPNKEIRLMTSINVLDYLNSESDASKKIIASTNPDLNLPSIPKSFIDHFIQEYNSNNLIEEIELKMDYSLGAPIDVPETRYDYKLKLQNNEVMLIIEEQLRHTTNIEMAAEKYLNEVLGQKDSDWQISNLFKVLPKIFIAGAKSNEAKEHHTKNMYSEKEVLDLLIDLVKIRNDDHGHKYMTEKDLIINWFKQNKKK